MKRRLLISLMLLATTVFAVVAFSRTQHPILSKVPTMQSNISFGTEKRNIALSENRLHLKLSNAVAAKAWRIGVHIDATTSASDVAVVALTFDGTDHGIKKVSNIVNWPQQNLLTSAGSVQVNGAAIGDEAVIFVSLPSGKELQVDAGSQTVFLATVTSDLVITPAGTTPKSIKGMGVLVLDSILPVPSGPDAPEVMGTASDSIATFKGLKNHLTSFTRPSFPAGASVDQDEVVTIKIAISPQGAVTVVKTIKGAPAFAAAASSALPQWIFAPFTLQGVAVAPTAPITLIFRANGSVVVPLVDSIQ